MSTPPIAFAVLGGDLDLVKSRVAAGADINQVTDKGTALHVACIYKREEIGRFLLENGANPRAKDWSGQMPIDVADDANMVALLREFGIQDFGLFDFNKLKRDSQKNALLLGNRNDVEIFSEMLDPIERYHGFYAPWLSLSHLQELASHLGAKETELEDDMISNGGEGPQLFSLDSSILRKTDNDDNSLFEHAIAIAKLRPFKKMIYWDKYRVFQLLVDIRALNFISKKRKLKLYFQQWVSRSDEQKTE